MGKKTVIICVALLVLAVAVCSVSLGHQVFPILAIVAVVFLVFIVGLKSIDGTLEKHPELALWDGTELLAYRKLELAAKNIPVISVTPLSTDPNPPRLGSAPLGLETSMSDDEEER